MCSIECGKKNSLCVRYAFWWNWNELEIAHDEGNTYIRKCQMLELWLHKTMHHLDLSMLYISIYTKSFEGFLRESQHRLPLIKEARWLKLCLLRDKVSVVFVFSIT